MILYQLIIDRAVKSPDQMPELVKCGPGDYDSTIYHPGWQYWEEHSKLLLCSSNYDKVLDHKTKIENGEIRVDNWTSRKYRLQIVCVED